MAGSFKLLAAADTLENGTTEAVRSATARDRIPSRTTFTIVAGIAIVAVVLVSKARSNAGPEDVNEQGFIDLINLYNASNSGGDGEEMSLGQKLDKSLQVNRDGVSTGRMARNLSMESQKIEDLELKHNQINKSYDAALQAKRHFVNATKLGKSVHDTLQDRDQAVGNLVVSFLSTKLLPNVGKNLQTIEDMIAAIGGVKAGIEAAMRNGLTNFSAAPVAVAVNPNQAAPRAMQQSTSSADAMPAQAAVQTAPPAVGGPPAALSPSPPANRGVKDTSRPSTDAPMPAGRTEPKRTEETGGAAEMALAESIAVGMEQIVACIFWAVEWPIASD